MYLKNKVAVDFRMDVNEVLTHDDPRIDGGTLYVVIYKDEEEKKYWCKAGSLVGKHDAKEELIERALYRIGALRRELDMSKTALRKMFREKALGEFK